MSLASEFVYAALDVNGLKGINDTLGHNAGDELIQGAAGMDAHITKPVNESKLKECMVRLLASREDIKNIMFHVKHIKEVRRNPGFFFAQRGQVAEWIMNVV